MRSLASEVGWRGSCRPLVRDYAIVGAACPDLPQGRRNWRRDSDLLACLIRRKDRIL
jgi:hypothetical protein